jgi:hypothetical protein
MQTPVPPIRETFWIEEAETSVMLLREGISIAFYLRVPHEDISSHVWRAVERYRRAIEPRRLGEYLDCYTSQWFSLDAKGEEELRNRALSSSISVVAANETGDSATGVGFDYLGRGSSLVNFHRDHPESVCALEFMLPIEFLTERGPEWIRQLAIDLGSELPWNSGHAGLALEVHFWARTITPRLREAIRNHPGFDLSQLRALSLDLGTKVRAPAWLNFLGPPVLNELGGAEALRARLHSPSTQVQSLSQDRALVSLGPTPEAGDTDAGDTLPAYRELARLLEPWLYAHRGFWGHFSEEETRQWERRFL